MEVLTGVDASGVDPLHLHEPAHRGGVNLTIVDAAADGVDGLLTLVALRPCLRLCIVLCLRLCRKIGQLLELLQAYIPFFTGSQNLQQMEKKTIKDTFILVAVAHFLAPIIVNRTLSGVP